MLNPRFRLNRPIRPHKELGRKGGPMTVCIAAMADDGRRLVFVSDTMVSTVISSADSAVSKFAHFRGWNFLLSGTLSPADLLYDTAKRELSAAKDNEPRTLRSCLEIAHAEELGRWTSGRWLSPYRLDWESYQKNPDRFTPSYRDELSRKILQDADSNYDAGLIVCGWGDRDQKYDRGLPAIYSINREGVGVHRTEGMFVMGSGDTAAMASLHFSCYRRSMTLAQVVYRVLEARFMAEGASGVGKETTFVWIAQRENGAGGRLPIKD